MPDYSTLTNAELITELNDRDATIVTRDAEIVTLNQTVSDRDATIVQLNTDITGLQSYIVTKDAEVADLNNQLDDSAAEIDELHTSDGVIGVVGTMTRAQKQTLQIKARTTSEGIAAYRALNYGV